MQNLEFGLTLTVLGMGGTLLILFIIGLVVDTLTRVLPPAQNKKREDRT